MRFPYFPGSRSVEPCDFGSSILHGVQFEDRRVRADNSHQVRMVIQQIGFEKAYRVVIYGDSGSPQHADFNNKQALLEALRLVLPDFDTSGLCLDPLREGQGSIVFAGEIELDGQQVRLLGMTDLSR